VATELAEYERRFRKAGLPLLIEDYSAREDVFTRAVPLLTLVFIAQVAGAIDLKWSLAANLGAIAGALALVLAALALLNRARGRPALSRPQDIGRAELAGFVVVPALLPLIFGFQWRSALVTAAGNALLLGLVYVWIGYGVVSITRWAGGRLIAQIAASIQLLTRALPLLLIFSLLTFLTTEMWQTFGLMSAGSLIAIGVTFVVLGTAFIAVSLPRMVTTLEREAGSEGPPLTGRQQVNVALVMFISQALQVALVVAAVASFFVLFGLLATTPEVQQSWTGHPVHLLWTPDVLGVHTKVSEELLRVSGAIAAFSGLYYAIAVLTDSTYREEFLTELTQEMGATFRDRAAYLRLTASTR
jgi:hypothetical protein